MLLATAACNFSTSQLQKVLRDRQFFKILSWKCASRHSGVQFFGHCNFEKCSENVVLCTFSLENVLLATAACNFSTSQLQKVVRSWHVLHIFTWKCASRHSGVQFFNISTSKSGPNLTCFVHFHLKMCFSPQRRAIFQHLNFKKWSEPDMFCTFSLENVLLATAACNFSTSQLQKVVRCWCVLVHFHFKMCFSPQRCAIFDFSSDHMAPHPPL